MTLTATSLYDKLKDIRAATLSCRFTLDICEALIPTIHKIQALKKEKNAIVLAHSYVSPEILHSVADHVGDSYELSKKAKESDADIIIFAAVKFMGETAKILSPEKTVVIPNKLNGCSLADSITADDVKALKAQYPNSTFVCYINTSAAVKAECDVCVTSSNASRIIESIPNDNIYFLPDKLMGQNIANELKEKGSKKTIHYSQGTCYVHEAYDPEMIDYLNLEYPDIQVVSHPECHPNILKKSNFVGSTSQMIQHVKNSSFSNYLLLTECGLTARLESEDPSKTFVGSCTMCQYMKDNSLDGILRVLKSPEPEDIIQIPSDIQKKAIHCINEMFRLNNG